MRQSWSSGKEHHRSQSSANNVPNQGVFVYTMEPQRLARLQAYDLEQGVWNLPENESRVMIQSITEIYCLIGDNTAKNTQQGIYPASGVRPAVEACCIHIMWPVRNPNLGAYLSGVG